MNTSNKKMYWKGLAQLKEDPKHVAKAHDEFVEKGPVTDINHSRRDFLKMMGFSLAAASVAACEAPVRKAIPYINKPANVDPGVPNYYASTYSNAGDCCSIVVKVRDGRPIKIEGNKLSPIMGDGVNAQVQASVLSLYDDYRLRGPKIKDQETDWETLDNAVIAHLNKIAASGGQIRLVSNTILSPSTSLVIQSFINKYPTTRHIMYDPVSAYGMRKANQQTFGTPLLPSYYFNKAKTIVSIAADFLGTWVSPVEFSKQYAQNRKLDSDELSMSRHYQFESNLTLTGANADYRVMIKPSQEAQVAVQLYNYLAKKAGYDTLPNEGQEIAYVKKVADELWEAQTRSQPDQNVGLVVSGSNDPGVQLVVNAINYIIGAYGSCIDVQNPVYLKKGHDEEMNTFIKEIKSDRIAGVIFYNCNPVYDHPQGEELAQALTRTPLVVSTSYTPDETSSNSVYQAPDHHYLESWNDFQPRKDIYSLAQPTITPIFKTRQGQESLLRWAGAQQVDYYTFIQENWKNTLFSKQSNISDFQTFWDRCVHDGVLNLSTQSETTSWDVDLNNLLRSYNPATTSSNVSEGEFELTLYESCGVGNGSMANNPLLQELPDPITKAVWDHYVVMSQADASRMGIENDMEGNTSLATISSSTHSVKLPVLIQPGQMPGTVGIAIGYGRKKAGLVAEGIGANAYPFSSIKQGVIHFNAIRGISITTDKEPFQLAQTQVHQTYMGRENVVQETVLSEFIENPLAFRQNAPKISQWDEKVEPGSISLWKGHEYKDHHWAMAIDLNACTGCGACVVACNVENNVALVGKEEVINRREMHWLRIDRYYSTPEETPVDDYEGMSQAAENPEVVFQPMLCQHCNNAPCETVCPVAATTHSTEGLNQMVYNRCIGTRYCANNCPYKVRRFNWFKYHTNQQFYRVNPSMNTDLGRMVLNPDVTVRSRGVMEKCSFCVQRIQAVKLTAKKEKRPVQDGEMMTACQATCSTGAIVFGDINDKKSRVSRLLSIEKNKEKPYGIDKKANNPRAYRVLEEVGAKPNIFYLTKVRNKDVNENRS